MAKTASAAKTSKGSGIDVSGKTVVLTGTFAGIERKDAETKLRAAGARVTGSVSKQTNIVFAAGDAGSKKATAESLGIPVYDEAALFAIIGTPKVAPKPKAKPPSAAAKAKVAERATKSASGFAGKTVVITGTLSKERAVVEAELKKAGARVTGSVSANTHILVAGPDAGSKLAKAAALGVKVIDEATMRTMLRG